MRIEDGVAVLLLLLLATVAGCFWLFSLLKISFSVFLRNINQIIGEKRKIGN
jgi:hypothetical protein